MKIETAEFVQGATRPGQLLKGDLPEVAFVGRSNVGKSSLLNKLLGRRSLARISRTPGRTQAVNYFLIHRRSAGGARLTSCHFVDLPGYGFAKAAKSARRRWAELTGAYLGPGRADSSRAPDAGRLLVIQLVDGKVGATDLDVEAHEYLAQLGWEMLKVATKIDKVPSGRKVKSLRAIRERLQLSDDVSLIPFSSVSGEGTKLLWRGITDFLDRPRES